MKCIEFEPIVVIDTFYLAVLLVDLMVMLKLSRHEHMKKVDQQS
jgi:hypothetical protein